jgi:hypothetical protein
MLMRVRLQNPILIWQIFLFSNLKESEETQRKIKMQSMTKEN